MTRDTIRNQDELLRELVEVHQDMLSSQKKLNRMFGYFGLSLVMLLFSIVLNLIGIKSAIERHPVVVPNISAVESPEN